MPGKFVVKPGSTGKYDRRAPATTTSRRWRREATVPTVTGPRSPHAAARNAAEYVKKEGPHED